MNLLSLIRSRFHPLWHMRRNRWLFKILSTLDFAVWTKSRLVRFPMRVMWLRDMSWLFDSVPKEPELNRLIVQICEIFQPKVFWDIGANLGWFTWLVISRTGLQQAVLFEALPLNASLLRKTIGKNSLHNITVIEAAVSDRCGKTLFVVDEQSGATSQIKEIFDSSGESAIAHTYGINSEIMVRTTNLDSEILNGMPVPDLIKMDIEEAEMLALRGATNLLSLGRSLIVFECHRREAIDLLKEINWSVYQVDNFNNYFAVPPTLLNKAEKIVLDLRPV